MKFLKNIKRELKTKWSSRLILALIGLVILNIVLVNFALKNEYNHIKGLTINSDDFAQFTTLIEKPFKYIKSQNGRFNIIRHETRSALLVGNNLELEEWVDAYKIENDTLTIEAKKQSTSLYIPEFYILTNQNIENITANGGTISFHKCPQKDINANISNGASLSISSLNDSIGTLNAHITDNSSLIFTDTGFTKIHNLNATLQQNSVLNIGTADFNNINLKNLDNTNSIILSAETLNKLIKKQ